MKMSELRQKTTEDLSVELLELRRAQFNFRVQRSMGQAQRVDQFSKLRRDIARIKTLLTERAATDKAS